MPKPTPPPGQTFTTFQVGSYTSATDTWTQTLDLNDSANFYLMNGSPQLPQPQKVTVNSFNVRTPGETVVRVQYKNRHIKAALTIRGATPQAIVTNAHSLIAAVEGLPYTLRIALPKASAYSYADVKNCVHNIPSDPLKLQQLAIVKAEVDFECYPFLRGDRLTLSNLTVNPGFEAPSGPPVTVFFDSFANTLSYALQAGSAPTLAANVMTLPANTRLAFGSPAWGAISTWQIRWQFVTGLTANFFLHFTDANNYLLVAVSGSSIALTHTVAGTSHGLASNAPTLTNGNFYWLSVTQFPAAAGTRPYITATLNNDSAGAIGSAVASGAVAAATFDAVTALVGRPQISAAGASLAVGGAFAGVHQVNLFGPGGWVASNNVNSPSMAWEQNTANTYPNGPVTSFAAARIDAPPTGAWNSQWSNYVGGAPAGTWAIPVAAAGDVLFAGASVKSSGLGNGATILLAVGEYNAAGTFLRSTTLQTFTVSGGVQAAWAAAGSYTLSGTVTTGANCAYAAVVLNPADTTSGSANATVWFDNVLCYDQTTTGQTSMPYCELRFPQSPAQLVVSGLLGDVAAPAQVSLGTYAASWANGVTLYSQIGRRASVGANAQLIAYFTSASAFSQVLDAASYGGFYNTFGSGASGLAESLPAQTIANIQGTYHVLNRAWGSDSTLANVSVASVAFDNSATSANSGALTTLASPLAAASTWQTVDAGQVTSPATGPVASLGDPTAISTTFETVWTDAANPTWRFNWIALLPIDGGICLLASKSQNGVPLTSYIFAYIDGLAPVGSSRGGLARNEPPTALPAPTTGVGPSLANTANVLVVTRTLLSTSDLFLTLDPALSTSLASGVNQFLAVNYSSDGAVWPTITELEYSPLYLYPRP